MRKFLVSIDPCKVGYVECLEDLEENIRIALSQDLRISLDEAFLVVEEIGTDIDIE